MYNSNVEKIEWLGYEISQEGITPLNEKVQAITDRMKPRNLKELEILFGSSKSTN